ncbi:hypothetical protein DB30_05209 [Enhygromyxa salina]|uniref:DNA-binding protein n=2 Tax=Enhygromyxa salina TaxID=215803 RepID=A0A0C2CXS5_9BACT|nr:hypothetical protein DB30_05209 [Enhygromyxa salina]
MSARARWVLPLVGSLLLTAAACSDDAGSDTSETGTTETGTTETGTTETGTTETSGETSGAELVTIEQARALDDGMMVSVEGHTSVAPGTFNSATGEFGFAIQDASGGIYIKTADMLDFPLDTLVTVTGTLGQMNQLRVIEAVAADIESVSGGQAVEPISAATGDIDEDVEGTLVEVSGTVTQAVQDDSPYGLKVYIDDGTGEVQVFVHLIDGVGVIDTTELAIDDTITVVGLVAQYEETYEVAPRQPSDLVVP